MSGVAFLAELGYPKVRLRTDGEATMKAMAQKIAGASGKQVLPETAPRESHSSMGKVEGFHESLGAQFRWAVVMQLEGSSRRTTDSCRGQFYTVCGR